MLSIPKIVFTTLSNGILIDPSDMAATNKIIHKTNNEKRNMRFFLIYFLYSGKEAGANFRIPEDKIIIMIFL